MISDGIPPSTSNLLIRFFSSYIWSLHYCCLVQKNACLRVWHPLILWPCRTLRYNIPLILLQSWSSLPADIIHSSIQSRLPLVVLMLNCFLPMPSSVPAFPLQSFPMIVYGSTSVANCISGGEFHFANPKLTNLMISYATPHGIPAIPNAPHPSFPAPDQLPLLQLFVLLPLLAILTLLQMKSNRPNCSLFSLRYHLYRHIIFSTSIQNSTRESLNLLVRTPSVLEIRICFLRSDPMG